MEVKGFIYINSEKLVSGIGLSFSPRNSEISDFTCRYVIEIVRLFDLIESVLLDKSRC